MSLCISDIPAGCQVTLRSRHGRISGRVLANYGGSLVIRMDETAVLIVSNEAIEFAEIVGAESVQAFEIEIGKKRAEFKQFKQTMDRARGPQ